MKKLLLLGSLVLTTSSWAYDNYMKSTILYSVPNDLEVNINNNVKSTIEMKSGYSLEIGLGRKISKNLALEAQYTYDKANVKGANANIKVHSVFLNGVYNFSLENDTVHPYIGVGIGTSSYTDGTVDDQVFSYQGFLGCSFEIDYSIETFVEYKYKEFKDVTFNDISYDDTVINSFGVGIKTKF